MRTRISLLTGIFVFSATIQAVARPVQEGSDPPASPSEPSPGPAEAVGEEDDQAGLEEGDDVTGSSDPWEIAEEVEHVEPRDDVSAVDAIDDPPTEAAPDAKQVVGDAQADSDPDTAGYRGGLFFLRDREDRFRVYPQGWLAIDFG